MIARPPSLAGIVTVVGGAFTLAGGLVLWVVGTVLAHVFGLSSPLFLGGVIVGVLTIGAGAGMWLAPKARRALGVLALACAVASIPLAFGGFVVGFLLTAIGGALALARLRPPVVVVRSSSPGSSPPWT
jgi:hypothetical protein